MGGTLEYSYALAAMRSFHNDLVTDGLENGWYMWPCVNKPACDTTNQKALITDAFIGPFGYCNQWRRQSRHLVSNAGPMAKVWYMAARAGTLQSLQRASLARINQKAATDVVSN